MGSVCDGTLAARAQAPVDDFGFVDAVAGVVVSLQTGRLTGGALGIHHCPATPTHEMVMVIAGLDLEAGRGARRLDAAQQTGISKSVQHVVHSLGRQRSQSSPRTNRDRLDIGVWALGDLGQNRQARLGHPQPNAA